MNQRDHVIWFTARTGSTWLASMLFSAGFPKASEYFHPSKYDRRAAYMGANTPEDYVRRTREQRAKNGVFLHEMTFQFWEMMSKKSTIMSMLDFRNPSIMLFREDIIQQAIAIHCAMQTGKWHNYGFSQNTEAITHDAEAIKRYAQFIIDQENGMRRHRDQLIPNACYFSYEKLRQLPASTVASKVGQHLDYTAFDASIITSIHQRVASQKNVEIYDKFQKTHPNFCKAAQQSRRWLFDAQLTNGLS